jgi:hypothetical protein
MDRKLAPEIWHLISSMMPRRDILSIAITSGYLLEQLLPSLYQVVSLWMHGSDSSYIATLNMLARVPSPSFNVHVLKLEIASSVELASRSSVASACAEPFLRALAALSRLETLHLPLAILSAEEVQTRFFDALTQMNLSRLQLEGPDEEMFQRKDLHLPHLKSLGWDTWDPYDIGAVVDPSNSPAVLSSECRRHVG